MGFGLTKTRITDVKEGYSSIFLRGENSMSVTNKKINENFKELMKPTHGSASFTDGAFFLYGYKEGESSTAYVITEELWL